MSVKGKTISSQAEEYLEAIYRLEKQIGFARTMDLSKKLGVVPGSITNTIDNLERKGLVIHEPYKGVKLTDDGRKIASNILRRHRLAERLLTDFFNLDWSEVHDPACKLEHAFTPEILKPLEKALGHPKTCPHGNPIPTADGKIASIPHISLNSLEPGEGGVVLRIRPETHTVLSYLASRGIRPGVHVEVQSINEYDQLWTLLVDGIQEVLGHNIVSRIVLQASETLSEDEEARMETSCA